MAAQTMYMLSSSTPDTSTTYAVTHFACDPCATSSQVELVHWKQAYDITGDRGVVKRMLQGGEGPKPDKGWLVTGQFTPVPWL